MDFKLYLRHQRQEIERYKWLKGQELGYDPGEEAVQEWIEKYAADYRKEYEDVYKQAIQSTSKECIDELKKKVPNVSDELWGYIFEQIIESFTEVWLREIITCQNDKEKKHLEEL